MGCGPLRVGLCPDARRPLQVLNCIVDMVEKTRRSVSVLRRCQEADRQELHYWRRRSSEQEEAGKSGSSLPKAQSPRLGDGGQTGENLS